MMDFVEITTTVETESQAQSLAEELVATRHAACVQITGPIHSVYRWSGELTQSTEYRCSIKTTQALANKVCSLIESLHPYDVPEIVLARLNFGSQKYEQWMLDQLESD